MLSARPDGAADVVLSSADWALLCKVDGNRDIADLAAECGFTVFEAAHVVRALMDGGLIDVELPDDEPRCVRHLAGGRPRQAPGVRASPRPSRRRARRRRQEGHRSPRRPVQDRHAPGCRNFARGRRGSS